MNQISETELIHIVIKWVHENAHNDGFNDLKVTPDTNLIASGLLTSLDMIDLLVFIEGQTECKIDLTDVEPSEFSVIQSLSRLALRNQNGAYKHADAQ
jgi:acyl carrier protein